MEEDDFNEEEIKYFETEGEEGIEEPAGEEPEEETPEEEPKEEEKKEEEPPKTVPLNELISERKARQEAERIRQELEQKYERLSGRFEMIESTLLPKEVAPSIEEDPAGYIAYQHEMQNKRLEQLEAERQADIKRQEEVRQFQALAQNVNVHVQDFISKTPDYQDAYNHLLQAESNELAAIGYTPQQIQHILGNKELEIAQQALNSGRNPAEIVYSLATQRGYKKAGEQKNILEVHQKGATMSKSLGNSKGNALGITAEEVANMSQEDFDRWYIKNKGSFVKL